MTILGLDFDNTLVHYDNLFHQLAVEKGLIGNTFPADKLLIRNYLRDKSLEDEFTLLQGEVYGSRILEAEPAEGMLSALIKLKKDGIHMILVSHKTQTPYKGPKYNLHDAAWNWLHKYGFFENTGIGWEKTQVHFAATKSEKIEMIKELKCTHFVDDLEEVLEELPKSMRRIHYSPRADKTKDDFIPLKSWGDITNLIKHG